MQSPIKIITTLNVYIIKQFETTKQNKDKNVITIFEHL